MGRSKSYASETDRQAAIKRTKELVRDIKDGSGLTYAEIAKAVSDYPLEPSREIVGEAMLKQYAAGLKPMSETRFWNIAQIGYYSGLGGDKCFEFMMFYNPTQNRAIRSLNDLMIKGRVLLEKRLEKAIEAYADADYHREQVVEIIAKLLDEIKFDRPEIASETSEETAKREISAGPEFLAWFKKRFSDQGKGNKAGG